MALIFIFPLSSAGKTLFGSQGPKREVNVYSTVLLALLRQSALGFSWTELGVRRLVCGVQQGARVCSGTAVLKTATEFPGELPKIQMAGFQPLGFCSVSGPQNVHFHGADAAGSGTFWMLVCSQKWKSWVWAPVRGWEEHRF